ncbi:hypothetical protein [Vibrio coralliilyticus]|uniref:hypothetical protein n=1 Tax=Vibrio coralliilyticus TaxID=190893 RepID=UPI00035CE28E|nr:hypothetical protein [Vibrio coralliilyticus]
MNNDEFQAALLQVGAVVVHFSHHSNMREGGKFPTDLQEAIENVEHWSLSCCVLTPELNLKCPGSVGIIFEPLSEQVLSVSNDDSGSSFTNGEERTGGVKLTQESFDTTFELVSDYNEWRVQGAKVKGIYIDDPNQIYVKKELVIGDEEFSTTTIGVTCIDLQEVKGCFPNMDLYSFVDSSLTKLN